MKNERRLKAAIGFCAYACMLQLLGSCTTLRSANQSPSIRKARVDTESQQATRPFNDPAVSGFFNDTPEREKEAWLLFTKDEKYRIAQPEEFEFPDAAIKLQGSDVDRASKRPYAGGDINRDGAYYDFAAIVVDRKQTGAERFSLVIFTQPSEGNGHYKAQLLYSGRDLSRTLLEWWSGGLAVREYREDGPYEYCYVTWDKQVAAYYCNKEFKQ